MADESLGSGQVHFVKGATQSPGLQVESTCSNRKAQVEQRMKQGGRGGDESGESGRREIDISVRKHG